MDSINNQKITIATKVSTLQDEILPDYQSGFLKSKTLEHEITEQYDDGIVPNEESKDIIKRRELEQTQELLVGLTNELFEKVEKLTRKKKSNNKTKEKPKSQETIKKKSNITFSDLSWYREKLGTNGEKNP